MEKANAADRHQKKNSMNLTVLANQTCTLGKRKESLKPMTSLASFAADISPKTLMANFVSSA
jgi:hypothetical protein